MNLGQKEGICATIITLSVRNKIYAIASYFKLNILAVVIPDTDSFIFSRAVGKIA